ncbi:hypothetical protein X801_05128, partial [Opisthorchis viverrini]
FVRYIALGDGQQLVHNATHGILTLAQTLGNRATDNILYKERFIHQPQGPDQIAVSNEDLFGVDSRMEKALSDLGSDRLNYIIGLLGIARPHNLSLAKFKCCARKLGRDYEVNLGTVVLKYVIIALEMREEVDIANPGALVENITQDKHQIRLEKGKRSLERLSYLPISVQEKDG